MSEAYDKGAGDKNDHRDLGYLLIWGKNAAFYTRKVKFTQETFCEKLSVILEGFPRLQDIHPFRE